VEPRHRPGRYRNGPYIEIGCGNLSITGTRSLIYITERLAVTN
jgi:hypothetical protein